MPRYFIEVAYKGTRYSGFQVQENASTIQSEIEKAFLMLQRSPVSLTGSSRTDAGVHALQNYFHFDFEEPVNPQFLYKMNAIIPEDIVIRNIVAMPGDAHARFDALGREYVYHLHRVKDPFVRTTSYYYPYKLDTGRMREAAEMIKGQKNFFAFAKTNTQVKNFICTVRRSEWMVEEERMTYHIEGNRFLRGMVRLLTASLLKVGRHKISVDEFESFFNGHAKCGFSVPAHGLFLKGVVYPENYFPLSGVRFTGF